MSAAQLDLTDRLFRLLRSYRDRGDAEAGDLLSALSNPQKYAARRTRRPPTSPRRHRGKMQ
jgi:hypothetical protein